MQGIEPTYTRGDGGGKLHLARSWQLAQSKIRALAIESSVPGTEDFFFDLPLALLGKARLRAIVTTRVYRRRRRSMFAQRKRATLSKTNTISR